MTLSSPIRRTLVGALVLVGLCSIGLTLLSTYSGGESYGVYLKPTQDFLQAGLTLDSVRLTRLNASPTAVRWALEAGRRRPALLHALQDGIRVRTGMHNGDKTAVSFGAQAFRRCSRWPLTVVFAGPAGDARIQDVVVACD